MKGICRHSPVLRRFYHKNYPYTTGSHWDKLTVGHTRQECDINMVFDVGLPLRQFCSKTHFQFTKYGMPVSVKFKRDDDKANFSYICVDYRKDEDGPELAEICVWDQQLRTYVISPIKLYKEFVEVILTSPQEKIFIPFLCLGWPRVSF